MSGNLFVTSVYYTISMYRFADHPLPVACEYLMALLEPETTPSGFDTNKLCMHGEAVFTRLFVLFRPVLTFHQPVPQQCWIDRVIKI